MSKCEIPPQNLREPIFLLALSNNSRVGNKRVNVPITVPFGKTIQPFLDLKAGRTLNRCNSFQFMFQKLAIVASSTDRLFDYFKIMF